MVNSFQNFLYKNGSNWYHLRFFPANPFIKSMYIWLVLVPLISKFTSKINEFLSFNLFGQQVDIHFSLPFNWIVFFFSALFFQIANIIFYLRCPKIIKDHLTFSGFISDGKLGSHLKEYADDVNISSDFNISIQTIQNFQNSNLMLNPAFQSKFWEIYETAKVSKLKWLTSCLVCYLLGFFGVIYILFQNILWVFNSIIK